MSTGALERAQDERTAARPAAPVLVVMLGAPGTGKGTQCARLADLDPAVRHLSSGSALRDQIERRTDVGRRAAEYVAAGRLVPDGLVTDVVVTELERHGRAGAVLLDGFPRTTHQADTLERLRPAAVRIAIELVVPLHVLRRRLSERGRADDHAAAVRRRLTSYRRDIPRLRSWFASRGRLEMVDGNQAPSTVTEVIEARLRRRGIDLHGAAGD